MRCRSKNQSTWNYNPKAKPRWCSLCAHFKETFLTAPDPWDANQIMRLNMKRRCTLGSFPVNPKGTCDQWVLKVVPVVAVVSDEEDLV